MIPSSPATSFPFSQVMDRSPHESAGALGSGAEKKVAFGAVAVSRSSLLLVPLVRGLWRAAARVLRPPLRAEAERVESVRSHRTEAGIGGEYRRVGRSLVAGGCRVQPERTSRGDTRSRRWEWGCLTTRSLALGFRLPLLKSGFVCISKLESELIPR